MFAIINELKKNQTHYIHFVTMFEKLKEYDCCYDEISNLVNNKNELKKYFINKYGIIPKFLITFGFDALHEIAQNLSEILKIIVIIDDIHHGKSIKKFRNIVLKYTYKCFCTYGYQINKWGLNMIEQNYFFPHFAYTIIKFNDEPIKKILISGTISNDYLDRKMLIEYSKINKNIDVLKKKVKCRNNTTSEQEGIYGKSYYEYLNKYLCCFLDSPRDYILAKAFEICASGSLLLYMNENIKNICEQIGFIDEFNYISCTSYNYEEKIKYILNSENLEKINNIRMNGHNLIKNIHNHEHRLKTFINILNNDNCDNLKKIINEKYNTYYYIAI